MGLACVRCGHGGTKSTNSLPRLGCSARLSTSNLLRACTNPRDQIRGAGDGRAQPERLDHYRPWTEIRPSAQIPIGKQCGRLNSRKSEDTGDHVLMQWGVFKHEFIILVHPDYQLNRSRDKARVEASAGLAAVNKRFALAIKKPASVEQ